MSYKIKRWEERLYHLLLITNKKKKIYKTRIHNLLVGEYKKYDDEKVIHRCDAQ